VLKRTQGRTNAAGSSVELLSSDLVKLMEMLDYCSAMRDVAGRMCEEFHKLSRITEERRLNVFAALACLSTGVTGRVGDRKPYSTVAAQFQVDPGAVRREMGAVRKAFMIRDIKSQDQDPDAGREFAFLFDGWCKVSDTIKDDLTKLVKAGILHADLKYPVMSLCMSINDAIGTDAASSGTPEKFSNAMVIFTVCKLVDETCPHYDAVRGKLQKQMEQVLNINRVTSDKHINTIRLHLTVSPNRDAVVTEMLAKKPKYAAMQAKLAATHAAMETA
jgi:hypothetical protein